MLTLFGPKGNGYCDGISRRGFLRAGTFAMGGALLAGNVAAVVRPPERANRKEGDLEHAPVTRSLVMAGIGMVATIWALVSLLA